jgi:hypothetical protein
VLGCCEWAGSRASFGGLILDRGLPVARLEGIENEDGSDRRARLERAGILVRGRGQAAVKLIMQRPPESHTSVLQALLDERADRR